MLRRKRKDNENKSTFDFNFGLKTSQIESSSRLYFLNKIPFKPLLFTSVVAFSISIAFAFTYKTTELNSFNKIQYISSLTEKVNSLIERSYSAEIGKNDSFSEIVELRDEVNKILYIMEYGGIVNKMNIQPLSSYEKISFTGLKNYWDSIQPIVRLMYAGELDFKKNHNTLINIKSLKELQYELINIKNSFNVYEEELEELVFLITRINSSVELLIKTTSNVSNNYNLIKDIKSFTNILDQVERNTYNPGKNHEYSLIVDIKNKYNGLLPSGSDVGNIVATYSSNKGYASYLNKELQVLLKFTKNYQNEVLAEKDKNILYGYFSIIALLFLIAIMFLVILASIEKNKKAARAAHELKRNQNNDVAINLLLDQIKPLANGDLTQRVYVSDKFVMQIADKIDDTRVVFASMIEKIKETSGYIAENANKTDETSKKLLEVSIDQFNHMDSFIVKITLIANEMIEIAENARSAQKNSVISQEVSKEGEILVRLSIDKMNEIRVKIQESAKKIKKSSESAQAITEVVELIRNITKQIEVLSLNAAIQAASSGEAGREFSVVAQEVKVLAEDSKVATESILKLVQEVKEDINRAVSSMEETTQEVVEGANYIGNAGRSLKEINDKSREVTDSVSLASKKLIDKSSEMSNISLNLRDLQSTTEMSKEIVKETAKQVEGLKEISKELIEKIKPYKIKKYS